MSAGISKEENVRRAAESRMSRHMQRKAAMAAVRQRKAEEKQHRIAARREAQQRREAAKVAAEVVVAPAPLSVCPWWSGDVEPVLFGGIF